MTDVPGEQLDEEPQSERGAVASPADEQPAQDTPDGESEEATTGPSHEAGTARGEDAGKG
jgi:hypothetical protein